MSRITQYQILADGNLIPPAAAPESITMDKWFARTQDPDARKRKRHQGNMVSRIAGTIWPPSESPNIVAGTIGSPMVIFTRTVLYQRMPVIPARIDIEDVNSDKWTPRLDAIVFDKKRQQYTYPSSFPDMAHVGDVEATQLDKWLPRLDDIVFDRPRNQHLYPHYWDDPTLLLRPESLNADKWLPSIPDILFDLTRRQDMYPAYFGLEDEPKEQFDSDWYPLADLPRWDIPRNQHTYPSMMDIDSRQLTEGEYLPVDRWSPVRPDIIFDKKRNQYQYPSWTFDVQDLFIYPFDVTIEKFSPIRPDIIFDLKRQQYTYPSLYYRSANLGLSEPEIMTAIRQTPVPLFDKKRQQFTYPSLALSPDKLRLGDRGISFHPAYIFDRKRLQYGYQFFFKEMSVLFFPGVPLTGWTPSDDALQAGWGDTSPPTNMWTENAVLDAAVSSYNEAGELYDETDEYDGYSYQEFKSGDIPPDTDWSGSNPNLGGWSPSDDANRVNWDEGGGSE